MAKQTNNSLNALNYFAEGLHRDVQDNFVNEKGWLSARNATTSSPLNDFNALSNEMSNRLVASAPYTIIGCVYINDGEWAIFSTDDDNCEIGIFNDKELKYTPFANSKELKFKKTNLIRGVGRIKKYCHRVVYWDDDLNESRFFDFDDIQWKGKWVGDECKFFEYDSDTDFKFQDSNNSNPERKILDIRKIQLSPNTFKGLAFTLNKGEVAGELPNGMYCVIGYYSFNGYANRLTSYFSMSNPQAIFTHENFGGSLEITVDEVDEEFEEFTLVIECRIEENPSFFIQGVYSTATKKITISQLDRSQPTAVWQKMFINNPIPNRTAGIYRIGQELVRIKPTMNQDFNYQPYANKIKTEWVSVRYPMDYYRNGGHNVGYMRDEVYSFFIRWIYNTGEKSALYHIPGREDGPTQLHKTGSPIGNKTKDGGVITDYGDMIFWESEERYNDKNKDVWEELCGKRIRHHKFPDNSIAPHYETKNGKTYINVLGVRFTDIHRPEKFVGYNSDGSIKREPINDIIGYEIMRGSREGNRSIIAKGMINNMRSYKSLLTGDDIYYQNYPYNQQTNYDFFLTNKKLISKSFSGKALPDPRNKLYEDQYSFEGENDISNFKFHKDIFSFHSPDMQMANASRRFTTRLTAKELVTYMIMKGKMEDIQYLVPQGAPKQKLIRTNAMLVSLILGIGYSMFKMYGVKHSIIKTPEIDYGPALAGYGTVELGTGLTSAGAIQAAEQDSGATFSSEFKFALEKIAEYGGKLTSGISGVDADKIKQDLLYQTNLVTGILSGKAGTTTTDESSTPYKEIPTPLRIAAGVPMFMTFWGEGINTVMDVLYAFAPFRNYYLQQVSHGYYNDYVLKDQKAYDIDMQSYIDNNGFVNLMNESEKFKVNNIKRHKTVFVKTENDIPTFGSQYNEISQYGASLLKRNSNENNLYSYYASMKQELPSQYGQLRSITPVQASYNPILNDSEGNPTYIDVVFGGDTYIGRYTEKNTFFPFSNWLNKQLDGEPFDYSKNPMLDFPRFWINSERYDIGSILDSLHNLIKNSGSSMEFNIFDLNDRFVTDDISVLDIENPDTIYTTIHTVNDEKAYEGYPEKYPKYVTEQMPAEEDDESFKNELLAKYNSQRKCSCDMFLINSLFDKVPNGSTLQNTDEFEVTNENNDLGSNDILKRYIVKEPDYNSNDILYDYQNPYSILNCKYVSVQNQPDVKQKVYKNKTIKEVWYNQPIKIKKGTYEKICDLKNAVDRAALLVAIGKGYLMYLQQTVHFFAWNRDVVDGDGTTVVDMLSLGWEKNNKRCVDYQYGDSIDDLPDAWIDDFFDDDWIEDNSDKLDKDKNDDYQKLLIRYSKDFLEKSFHNINWKGFANSIPYSNNADDFNPLLLYFIQSNTDIILKYPGIKKTANDRFIIDNEEEFCWKKILTYGDSTTGLNLCINEKDGCNKQPFEEFMDNFPEWANAIGYDGTEKNSYKNILVDSLDKEHITLQEFNEILNYLLNNNSNFDISNLKYYTLNQVRNALGVDKTTKKNRKRTVYFTLPWLDDIKEYSGVKKDKIDTVKEKKFTIHKLERCKLIYKAVTERKGKLYNKAIKKQENSYNKAVKRYNKKIQELNDTYVKSQTDSKNNFFAKLKKAFNAITPMTMYNLDNVGYDPTLHDPNLIVTRATPSKLGLFVKDMYMYQFISGVRDFFVESEQNIDLRQWGDYNALRYYDHVIYDNLPELFTTDDIDKEEFVKFDQVYIVDKLIQNQNNTYYSFYYQEDNYDEAESYYCRRVFPNRLIYSNPDADTSRTDGWRMYLAGNSRNFNDEFTTCISYGEDGLMMLFRNTSPISIQSAVELKSSAEVQTVRITQGSGELFNQRLKHMDNVDSIEYGSCQDEFSAINCPSGLYYVSQEQAKIFTFHKPAFSSMNISDISTYASGLNAWFKHYMPYMLTRDTKVFKETPFELGGNTVSGVGFITSYDNLTQILYVSKKDYKIKEEYVDKMKYVGNGKFIYENSEIILGDKRYFDDASFTLSYDTRIGKGGTYVSFHDWHPDLVMNSSDRIFTTKDNGIWRHNDSTESFCNFYGDDYPFEVEFPITSENTVSTLRSISYFLECFTYDKNEYDRYHKLFENFDQAIIYNSEQISGKLILTHSEKENPMMIPEYPKVNDYGNENSNIEILYSKEEQRYRFNQFWDITKDRMYDYDNDVITMFNTEPNGYVRTINPRYVDYSKPEFERKKFRHRINKVRLIKTKSGKTNIVFSLSMNHNLNSMR